MKNYISLYEHTITQAECESLILKFEKYTDLHEKKSITGNDGWHMQFTQINLGIHEVFEKENAKLRTLFLNAIA